MWSKPQSPTHYREKHIAYLKGESERIRQLTDQEFAAQLPLVNWHIMACNLVETQYPQWLEREDA